MRNILCLFIILNTLNFNAQDPIYNKDSTVKFNLLGSPSFGFSAILHDFNSLNQELSISQAPELNDLGFAFSIQQNIFSTENLKKDKQWLLSHSFNWQNIKQVNDSAIQTRLNYQQYYWTFNYNILPASKQTNLYIGLGLGFSVYNLSISDITGLNNFQTMLNTFNSSNISKTNGIAQLNIALQTKHASIGLAYTFNAINGNWKQFENTINDGPDMGLGVPQLKFVNVF